MQKQYKKGDIIFALVQYQHGIIFALSLFAVKLVIKDNCRICDLFLVQKMRFSNFQNNEYDVMIERDVIFHATSDAIDVIKVDVM